MQRTVTVVTSFIGILILSAAAVSPTTAASTEIFDKAEELLLRERYIQAYRLLTPAEGGSLEGDHRAAFLLGYAAFRSNQNHPAEKYLKQVADSDYVLRHYAAHYLGLHYLKHDDYRQAEEVFRTATNRDSSHPLFVADVEGYLDALEGLGKDSVTAAVSLETAGLPGMTDRAGTILIRGAGALARMGKTDQAVACLQSVIESDRDAEAKGRAARELLRLVGDDIDKLSPDLLFRTGRVLFDDNRYSQAQEPFECCLKKLESGFMRDRVRIWLGRTYIKRRRYSRAEREFKAVIKASNSQISYMPAGLWLARLYLKRGRLNDALVTFQKVADRYPDHHLADDALWEKARALEKYNRDEAAIECYRNLVNLYPASEFAEQCLWQAGFKLYLKGELDNALREFNRGLTLFPDGNIVMKFSFWRGKILQQTGRLDQASKAYLQCASNWPDSYYAHRAIHNLDTLYRDGDAWPRVRMEPDDRMEQLTVAHNGGESDDTTYWSGRSGGHGNQPGVEIDFESEGFRRGAELTRLGLWQPAEEELRRFLYSAPREPYRLYLIARRLNELGHYPLSIRAAEMAIRHGEAEGLGPPPVSLLRLLYPSAYSDLVERAAERFNLDPDFIYALMREESLFNPIIHSPVGAIGLMQLMYRTARGVTGAVGLKRLKREDLYDPSINTLIGSWFLSHQLKRFDDNPILAVAAYNGGPTNVRKWQRRAPEKDIDLFLEKIPYQETKSHVRKVFRTYQRYKDLWRS